MKGLAPAAPNFLKLLAHDLRWRTLVALAYSDRRVQELVEALSEPQNTVSYHLKRLRDVQLVRERRSSADGRDVYYSVDLEKLQALYSSAGEALHPALGNLDGPGALATPATSVGTYNKADGEPPVRVLFLCTHNSARSQMAEAIMQHLGGSIVEVYSAGTHPSNIHPEAIRVLAAMNIDVSASRMRSKHLDEYCKSENSKFDYIITVCDRVREACPLFPGDPEQIHWSFPDPAAVEDKEEQHRAFLLTAQELTTRIRFLLLVIENERKNKQKLEKAEKAEGAAR